MSKNFRFEGQFPIGHGKNLLLFDNVPLGGTVLYTCFHFFVDYFQRNTVSYRTHRYLDKSMWSLSPVVAS